MCIIVILGEMVLEALNFAWFFPWILTYVLSIIKNNRQFFAVEWIHLYIFRIIMNQYTEFRHANCWGEKSTSVVWCNSLTPWSWALL
jgi:hypothetical protein